MRDPITYKIPQHDASSISVKEMAERLSRAGCDWAGQNRLFERLREDGYLAMDQGARWNLPTRRAMELGLFEVHVSSRTLPDGSVKILRTPLVTQEGVSHFLHRYAGAEALPLPEGGAA